jgi:hypothetical protein
MQHATDNGSPWCNTRDPSHAAHAEQPDSLMRWHAHAADIAKALSGQRVRTCACMYSIARISSLA